MKMGYIHHACTLWGENWQLCQFQLETNSYWERILEKFAKKRKKKKEMWHLLQGVTLWTIWIEGNDMVFNCGQLSWCESKVKHLICDDLITYAKMAWARVTEIVNNIRLAQALLKALTKYGGHASPLQT